jgi:hypothetical protein
MMRPPADVTSRSYPQIDSRRPRTTIRGGRTGPTTTKTDQLATLMTFLLLGYLALTVAGAFAFTFIW